MCKINIFQALRDQNRVRNAHKIHDMYSSSELVQNDLTPLLKQWAFCMLKSMSVDKKFETWLLKAYNSMTNKWCSEVLLLENEITDILNVVILMD